MIEAPRINAAEKLHLLELLYRRLPDGTRLRPSTKALLHLFADCESALHWSVARIAETLGFSMRTVIHATNQLREWGILSTVRKQREVSSRRLNLDAAREIRRKALISIRKRCAIAVAALRAGFDVKQLHPKPIRFTKMAAEEALRAVPVASVSDLSPQLRALMRR